MVSGSSEAAETLLDDAESALDGGDPEAAIQLCGRALELSPGHPGAYFVLGDALRALGRLEDAANSYRSAALGKPDHASSWAALALTCFDLLEFDEAQRAASRALREEPRNPEGWWVRSLLLEWRGDRAGSQRALAHARWLDPAGFSIPPRLTDPQIESLVEECLSDLHPTLRDYLAQVAIIVQDVPDEQVLRSYDPPASPIEILGFFSGHSLMDRSLEDPWSGVPPTITLYRNNIARISSNHDELVAQLRLTLYHEIGHFLGLSEEDLVQRGLE